MGLFACFARWVSLMFFFDCFQMDTLSLNNDDDYASDNWASEQEMDENNPVVDESLMSTAEVKGKHKRRHSKC